MKTSLILIGCWISLTMNSQTSTHYQISSHDVGILSPKKDTLYLINDILGRKIKEIWDNDKLYQNPPKIVLIDKKVLAMKMNANLPKFKRSYPIQYEYAD